MSVVYSMDATMCVAVLHHISTARRRQRVIDELFRVTAFGGHVLLHVWALGGHSKFRGNRAIPCSSEHDDHDVLVPWHLRGQTPTTVTMANTGNAGSMGSAGNAGNASKAGKAGMIASASASISPSANEEDMTGRSTGDETMMLGTWDEERQSTVFHRYCHIFQVGELQDLVSAVQAEHAHEYTIVDTDYFEDGENWGFRATVAPPVT